MRPWLDDGDVVLYHGEALEVLEALPESTAQCLVTSPPFWSLRNYDDDRQLGLEATPDEYVARLVAVMREARRVLRPDGVAWIEIGDTYAGSWGNQGGKEERGTQRPVKGGMLTPVHDGRHPAKASNTGKIPPGSPFKAKDLVGVPWLVAFALRDDGWYLRAENLWHRPNPMPSSATDRPTVAHSTVFLLSTRPRYYYDADAIREPLAADSLARSRRGSRYDDPAVAESVPYAASRPRVKRRTVRDGVDVNGGGQGDGAMGWDEAIGANARTVWTIPSEPTRFAHFATMPTALARKCILAGSREGDVILDPFAGSGTTALAARRAGRRSIGIDLNAGYLTIARERLAQPSLPLAGLDLEPLAEQLEFPVNGKDGAP